MNIGYDSGSLYPGLGFRVEGIASANWDERWDDVSVGGIESMSDSAGYLDFEAEVVEERTTDNSGSRPSAKKIWSERRRSKISYN